MTIRNPIEWSFATFNSTGNAVRRTFERGVNARAPAIVRELTLADLGACLRAGWQDFLAYRTDVLFLCAIYPLAGLVIARAAVTQDVLPLVFPLLAGFALVGPFLAAGLYEMSRRRETGATLSWFDAFGIFASPAFGAVATLGLIMTALFVAWLGVALGLYHLLFGYPAYASPGEFLRDIMTSARGWSLILVGGGIGFLFAIVALGTSAVSFPLLIDRDIRITDAVATSWMVLRRNPTVMLSWGLIVATLLVLGMIPLLLGLIVVMPVLGHATWHLYRRAVG